MKFFCEYCGTRIDSNVDNCCPNCKATYKNNKTFIEYVEKEKQREEKIEELSKNIHNRIAKSFNKNRMIITIFIIFVFMIIMFGFISMVFFD